MSASDGVRLAAYAFLAVVAFWSARAGGTGERWALRLTGILSVLFGVALTIGLAGEFAQAGRDLAAGEGWYAERRPIQAAVVIGLLAAGTLSIAMLGFAARKLNGWVRLTLAFGVLLSTYVAIHTISLHQLDAVLNRDTRGGLRTGDQVEIALVLCCAFAAFGARYWGSLAGRTHR